MLTEEEDMTGCLAKMILIITVPQPIMPNLSANSLSNRKLSSANIYSTI